MQWNNFQLCQDATFKSKTINFALYSKNMDVSSPEEKPTIISFTIQSMLHTLSTAESTSDLTLQNCLLHLGF